MIQSSGADLPKVGMCRNLLNYGREHITPVSGRRKEYDHSSIPGNL